MRETGSKSKKQSIKNFTGVGWGYMIQNQISPDFRFPKVGIVNTSETKRTKNQTNLKKFKPRKNLNHSIIQCNNKKFMNKLRANSASDICIQYSFKNWTNLYFAIKQFKCNSTLLCMLLNMSSYFLVTILQSLNYFCI